MIKRFVISHSRSYTIHTLKKILHPSDSWVGSSNKIKCCNKTKNDIIYDINDATLLNHTTSTGSTLIIPDAHKQT
jgi:hypothetical protein